MVKQENEEKPPYPLQGNRHPLERANLFSLLAQTWLNPFIKMTSKGRLFDQDMHPELPKSDSTMHNFTKVWIQKQMNPKKGLMSHIWAIFGGEVMLTLFIILIESAIGGAIKYITLLMSIELEIQFKEKEELKKDWSGVVTLLISLVLFSVIQSVISSSCSLWRDRISFRIQFSLSATIFDKILKVGLVNPSPHDEGSITNNLQIDCSRFGLSVNSMAALVSVLLNFFITLTMGIWLFKFIFVILLVVLTFNAFFLGVIFFFWFNIQNKWMKAKDERMSFWKYCFSSIRYFKIRAWEIDIFNRISKSRSKEVRYQLYSTLLYSVFILSLLLGPAFAVFTFFKIYFGMGNILEISKVAIFMTLVFDMITTFLGLPSSFGFINEVSIAVNRLNKLLDFEEIDLSQIKNIEPPLNPNSAIEMRNASFYWKLKPPSEDDKNKNKEDAESKKKQEKDGYDSITNIVLEENDTSDLNDSLLEKKQEEGSGSSYEINIDQLQVLKGNVTFLIGKIGSGKSSLLYAIMGDMSLKNPDQARLNINTSFAFVGQKPWIINSTIKDNILLDLPLDQAKLDEAIRYSCLDEELKIFEKGIDQETGDNGDALSGGQRTRVAIARCLYQDPEIYIFDDVLSALDSNVGAFIMEETILKRLRGKTVLMSTHAIQYLSKGDKIVIMEGGKIEAQGNFEEVSSCEIYQRYLEINKQFEDKKVKDGEEEVESEEMSVDSGEPELIKKLSKKKTFTQSMKNSIRENDLEKEEVLQQLIIPEDRERGSVSLKTYHRFIQELGGYSSWILVFAVCLSAQVLTSINMLRLSQWGENFATYDTNQQLMQYFIISLIAASLCCLRTSIFGVLSCNLSKKVHSKMIFSILHSRVEEFISRVPAGRIMNRFSRDLQEIDQSLIFQLDYFNETLAGVVISIGMFGFLLGYRLMISIVFMLVFCIYYQKVFMDTWREFIRLDSISKTPILNVLVDSCRGLSTIRSMNKQAYFRRRFIEKCNASLSNSLIKCGMNHWYAVRVSFISYAFITIPAYLTIILFSEQITLAIAIFSIIAINSLGSSIKNALTQYSRLESTMISVERCHYFEKIEPEAQYKHYRGDLALVDGSDSSLSKLKKRQEENKQGVVEEGRITFQDVSCKYAISRTPVLSGVSFEVKPREKIGVIGRTGSGKSTLIKLLWRGLDYCEGDIKIDGKSIRDVDLKSLRSQVMIVTQETALIEGTLRANIDIRLEGKERDRELEDILYKLGFNNQNYLKEGLEMPIDGEGSNLSAGEKQLISFARTLLDKKKVIVLDEATANIDLKTEEKIQKCLDNEFKDATMIIIAHRIQTIMNCDRILVLEKGKIAAFDSPQVLSSLKDSYFNKIINKMKESKEENAL